MWVRYWMNEGWMMHNKGGQLLNTSGFFFFRLQLPAKYRTVSYPHPSRQEELFCTSASASGWEPATQARPQAAPGWKGPSPPKHTHRRTDRRIEREFNVQFTVCLSRSATGCSQSVCRQVLKPATLKPCGSSLFTHPYQVNLIQAEVRDYFHQLFLGEKLDLRRIHCCFVYLRYNALNAFLYQSSRAPCVTSCVT